MALSEPFKQRRVIGKQVFDFSFLLHLFNLPANMHPQTTVVMICDEQKII
jgi:hypothetical protein